MADWANRAARMAERSLPARLRNDGGWIAAAARHWNIDRGEPR